MSAEILAPAGGREQLEAAVRAGCDAVYLGFGSFNARRNAKNFTGPELAEVVSYCHKRNVNVHITLNTLLLDAEAAQIEEDLAYLAASGADAVIVQDLGLAALIREAIPSLALHASTQLAVHNAAGVALLQKMGFTRVVLARELSVKEIEAIRRSTDAELEVFIHGALCMCLSGGCYLSSVLGQRSGNRGLCAQPCRLDFSVKGRDHALSLKDMSHLAYLPELERLGIASFKIEGRMKRPEYVACAVHAAREALAGRPYDSKTLQAVFSRSGFTDGYATGKRDLSMFGYRQKEDVQAGQSVLHSLTALYKNEFPHVPLQGEFFLHSGQNSRLLLSDGTVTATVLGSVPEKAMTRSLTQEDIIRQLKKTGGTPYCLNTCTADVEDGLSMPLAEINRMRREAIEALDTRRESLTPHPFLAPAPFAPEEIPFRPCRIVVRVHDISQLAHISPDCAVVPLKQWTVQNKIEALWAEIPSLVFPEKEETIRRLLLEKKAMGLTNVVCENIGAVFMALEAGLTPVGGYGLNVLNSRTLARLKGMGVKAATVSFECSMAHFRALKHVMPIGQLVYGFLPLMRMRACPAQGRDGCRSCSGLTPMTDRMHKTFFLQCNDKQFTTLLNAVPLYVCDKPLPEADFRVLYFTSEDAGRVREVYRMALEQKPFDGEHTGGLYYKTLR